MIRDQLRYFNQTATSLRYKGYEWKYTILFYKNFNTDKIIENEFCKDTMRLTGNPYRNYIMYKYACISKSKFN